MFCCEARLCGCGKHFGIGLDGSGMTSSFRNLDRRIFAGWIALVAIAFCLGGCDSHPAAVDASAATPAPAAAVARPASESPAPSTAEISDPKSFTTMGPLVAEQQADIAAERNGRVVSINVRIGDRVKKGQVLAELDDRALRSACESQKAKVASAKAQLREWQAEQLTAEADLRRADAMRDA